jgi:serine/threonine protein kinase
MEYMAGGSVADIIEQQPLPEEACAVVIRGLLLGLDYLHSEGKIHRDIKCANVLLTAGGQVRVATPPPGVRLVTCAWTLELLAVVNSVFWLRALPGVRLVTQNILGVIN